MELLPDGEAHLWYVRPEALSDLDAARAILTNEELAANGRFRFADSRAQHLTARVLVRRALSLYAPVEPSQWVFEKNEYGRPAIAGSSDLHFNLSHTTGLVACLIGRQYELGVDVEHFAKAPKDCDQIAHRFFSPSESAELQQLPDQFKQARFLQYWTLKESYIKARGMGLAISLTGFSFKVDMPDISIQFASDFDDTPVGWKFEMYYPTSCHLIAVSVRSCDRVIVRDATELVRL